MNSNWSHSDELYSLIAVGRKELVLQCVGPGPETWRRVAPGGLRGQRVVQWVLSVCQDPVQPFQNNTFVDGAAVSAELALRTTWL